MGSTLQMIPGAGAVAGVATAITPRGLASLRSPSSGRFHHSYGCLAVQILHHSENAAALQRVKVLRITERRLAVAA
ncbi:hypothetical protein [Streptomyces chryseus]|uniref:hypothetical protein n=1 Tax=Streptomyces chryseus TaxID=68186 RepID=UPI0019B0C3B1|nr:hypothetical protein [Streptomyces chryseus]GGX39364.1 hypothetical protein GCM10010353_63500 [Streptomyces chryseus]